MSDIGSPLKTFIQTSLDQIKEGIGDNFYINKSIEFELSVATTGKVEGGLDIFVVKLGGNVEQQAIQKIKLSVNHKDSLEYAETEAFKKTIKERPEVAMTKYFRK